MACYKLAIEPDGDVWLVTSDDFPELVTFGKNKDEAYKNAQHSIEEAIAGRIADGEDIPAPLAQDGPTGCYIELPMMIYLKSAIYMIMREQGMNRAELQRKLGWQHREQIDRLFRLDHQTKLDSIEEAFKALGVPLQVNVPFQAAA